MPNEDPVVPKEYGHLWHDLLITAAKGTVGAGALYRFASQPIPDWPAVRFFGIALGLLVALEAGSAFRSHRKRYRERIKQAIEDAARQSVEPLDAMLDTLHAILVGERTQEDHGLRICLWEPDEGDHLRQMTEYAGTSVKGYKGRRESIMRGIIGQVYRTKSPILKVAKLSEKKGVSFVDQMVNDFGYPEDIARRLRPDRKAWAAVAIGDPDAPSAVLYLDTKQRQFFGNKNSCCQRAIQAACVSIAGYLGKR